MIGIVTFGDIVKVAAIAYALGVATPIIAGIILYLKSGD